MRHMSTLRLQILHSLRETEEEKAPDHDFMLYARPFAVNAVHLNVSTLRLEMCITLKNTASWPSQLHAAWEAFYCQRCILWKRVDLVLVTSNVACFKMKLVFLTSHWERGLILHTLKHRFCPRDFKLFMLWNSLHLGPHASSFVPNVWLKTLRVLNNVWASCTTTRCQSSTPPLKCILVPLTILCRLLAALKDFISRELS